MPYYFVPKGQGSAADLMPQEVNSVWRQLIVELCADVIVSATARRSISVGGGGGAAWSAKNIF